MGGLRRRGSPAPQKILKSMSLLSVSKKKKEEEDPTPPSLAQTHTSILACSLAVYTFPISPPSSEKETHNQISNRV